MRFFEFKIELDFYSKVNSGSLIVDLIDRVNKYLKVRSPLEYDHQQDGSKVILKFAKLDDAQMFVLAFSDVIETKGQRFD